MSRLFGSAVAAALSALGWSAASDQAVAQSFDCARASTRVERLICGDDRLKGLDTGLAGNYLWALDEVADPDALVRSQRAWLRERDACRDAACVAEAYDGRTAALEAAPRAGVRAYNDRRLGAGFEYLANRTVRPCGDDRPNCVVLEGRYAGKPGVELMRFEAFEGDLEAIAEREAGFERRDGGWFTTYGRGTPQAARPFAGPNWRGLEATITCGISDETGFHAAGGECYWGVASDGRTSILITTDGIGGLDERTRRSVETLRFFER